MAVPKQTHIFTDSHIKDFLTESKSCTDVLDSLVNTERRRTEVTLNRPGLPPDYVTQMVTVLVKAVQSTNTTGVIDLLSVLVGSQFFTQELVMISSAFGKSTDDEQAFKFIETTVELLNQVSLRLPSSFTNAFGLILILQKRTEDILLTAEGERRKYVASLSERLEEMRDDVMKRMVAHSHDNPRLPFEKQAPPDDFRNIPILPRVSDIFLESRGAFLRKNKSRGGYDNLHHYLDVQFRLYREDCISPLREGITQYVQEVSAGHSVRRLQDGRLYKNISVEYVEHNVEGQMYKVTLDQGHAQRIKWKSSRRLLYGSLLCLSADSFHTMVFAIVAESDRDILAKDHSFKIVFPTEVGEMRLPLNTTFTMVESTAYFEAYRHVLAGLQRLEEGELPFEKYIVRCMKDVDLPLYLTVHDATYDLQPIVSGEKIFRKELRRHLPLCVNMNGPVSLWPSAEELQLDQSQFEAYHAALTQEFVLIQGPPGTGKTHVGLQIAKTLLHNKNAWQGRTSGQRIFRNTQSKTKEQVLVVCYTNHALDQFIEGIVKFLDSKSKEMWHEEIVRVGGRSENEAVQDFSLKNRRHHHHHHFYDRQEQEKNLDQLYNSIISQHRNISVLAYSLSHVNDTVLNFEFLQPVMQQHQHFFLGKDQLPSEKLFRWLEVDKNAWLRRSNRAYKKTSQLKTVPTSNKMEETILTDTNIKTIEENEAKKVEDDRKIEDDDFGAQFKEEIGLDVRQQLVVVLENIQSNEHLDMQFQSLVQREANSTLSKLKAIDRMDENEARSIRGSLNKLPVWQRWRLYRQWVYLYQQMQNKLLPELEKEYYETIKTYQKEKKQLDAEILKASTLIGMTTTGAAKYHDVLKEIGPRIVIVEEAAEVLEAHIITALSPRCEHLILIGDHKQLEPKPSVMQLALKYNLSLSMFERMLNNGIKNHCLQRQHRMRPEISILVRDIYDVLDDNENVFEYEHIMGVRKDVFFINHSKPEDYAEDIRSYSNMHEAKYIAKLCKYLLKQGYESNQITVLAAYTGQMFCIRDCMPRQEFEGVKTVAIDNFQGEENDIILLSLVRSNKDGKIGFLSRENRICVALSRAKKGLYVIGNFNMFESRNSRWADIVQKVKMAGQFGKALPLYCQNHPQAEGIQAEDAADFTKSPEGGCELKCDFRLCCGHACRLYCHPIDRMHTKYICKQLCNKTCLNDHICKKKCHFGETCECPVTMNKVLPCGHRADMKCCHPAQTFTCNVIVDRELGCGHSVKLKCHINTETYMCKIIVTRTLEACSHKADMQCWEDPDTHKCRTKVTRILELCEHEAVVECCFDMRLYKCKIKVNRSLPSCGHEAEMYCYKNPADVRCDETLTKTRNNCEHIYDVRCCVWNTYYERRNPCLESVTKSWACSHTKVMKCHESEYAICQDKCLKICDRSHTCQKKCHHPSSCKCDVIMTKIIPKCGHTQEIPCYKDPDLVECQTMVLKRLTSCSHEMMMKCSADPSSLRYKSSCDTLVPKTVPLCHHTQTMKCSESPAMYRCKEIVGKPHPRCGHTIQVECCTTPSSTTKCETIVSKSLPCGHEKEIECSKSFGIKYFHDRYYCEKNVEYLLSKCGHTVTIPCYVNTSLDKQKRTVAFKRLLLDPPTLPTCKTTVTKTFICGHETTVECGNSKLQTCSTNCSKSLSCGHTCTRKCKQCFESLTHGDCIEPCRKRQICGHICTSTTCGSCKLCSEKCDKYCPHRRCDHPCFRECIPCSKPCPLQCPHYSCSRLCNEECDRPPCDQPCPKLLKCEHPCMGYCGDPCPSLCLVCEPLSWSDFEEEWNTFGDVRIVRLEDCGHELSARYLDKMFAEEENVLHFICCPTCATVIKWHSRYSNLLKKQWDTLAIAKRALVLGSEDMGRKALFPMICWGIEEIRSYLQRFSTQLFFQKELQNCRIPLKSSYNWSKSTTDQVRRFLHDLGKTATILQQDASCINQTLTKLSATWLLYIANTLDEDISSSDSEDEHVTSSDLEDDLDLHVLDFDNVAGHKERHVNKSEKREKSKKTKIVETTTNEVLHAVDDLIKKSEAFNRTELCKVRQMLEVLLTDLSEINQVMNFPRLQTIGVHANDWIICSAGHIGPAVFRDDYCGECTTGTPLTLSYKTFLENWRGQFEMEQNPANNAQDSKTKKRSSKRGGNGIERGGRGSEMGWRGSGRGGSENSMHGTNRGQIHEDEDDKLLQSGPTYMVSPHQPHFQHRGRGRAGRGQERGGFRGQRGGRGGSRGEEFGNDIFKFIGGFGRGMGRGNAAGRGNSGARWDDRGSVGDVGGERVVGFGKEEIEKGMGWGGAVNRRGGLRVTQAVTVAAAEAEGLRGVNTRGRDGRGGGYRGRGGGDRGRGGVDRGRGVGDRGRGGGDRGRVGGDRGRGGGDRGRGGRDRERGSKGWKRGRRS